ncbi:MAG: hypothetical protein N2C14_03405 [Planctomycetales bacterium]
MQLVTAWLYCSVMEWKLKLGGEDPRFAEQSPTSPPPSEDNFSISL